MEFEITSIMSIGMKLDHLGEASCAQRFAKSAWNGTLFFCLLFLFMAPRGHALDISDASGARVTDYPAPKFLYHWATSRSLSEQNVSQGEWISFKPTYASEAMFQWRDFFPDKLAVLYTWNNPIAGMAALAGSEYGDCLVQIELDPDAKVLHVKDGIGVKKFSPGVPFNPREYDVLFREGPRFNEWIILNPRAIRSFTADPDRLGPVVESELQKISDGEWSQSDLHCSHFDPRIPEHFAFAAKIARNFLTMPRSHIPSKFLRTKIMGSDPAQCSKLLSESRANPTLP